MTQPYRAQSLDRRLFGVAAGLVEAVDDPEHEGRIRVRFPWLDDATVSEWCRVTQPYAGNNHGAFFIPEIGAEVLVAFIHGDMNEPVVLGGLYNGQDKPATYRQGSQQDVKLIRTAAGHELRLDDSAQARAIELKTAGGHDLKLDDQNRCVTVTSTAGHKLVLDDQGLKVQLTVSTGAGSLTIDSTGKVDLKGTTITISGTAISLSASSINIGG